MNNENTLEDLSATIIERRKRLHNLAVEINQWTEDESAKKSSQQSLNIDTTLNGSDIVGASPSFFTPRASATVNYFSPKQYSFSACKPSTTHHNYSKPLNSVNNILGAKKMNNYENNNIVRSAGIAANNKRVNDDNSENQPPLKTQTSSGSLVKSIKSKFEEGGIITQNPKPKSIIQKFEQMSSATGSLPPQPQFSIKKNTSTTNVEHPKLVAPASATPPTSSAIYTDHIKPRSIIEKFEQMTKSNKKESIESIGSKPHNMTSGTASLTFVSSIQSLDQVGLEDEETVNEGNQSCIEIAYDELEDGNNKDTFLDEDAVVEEETEIDNTRGMNSLGNDAFSLSACSSYTGSMINTDFEEVDDDDVEEYEDQDSENQDVEELSQLPDETTLISCSTAESHRPNDETAESTSSMTSSLMSEATDVIVPIESLFSIKEYRKQKRNGGRRSSMVPKVRQTQVINAQMVAKSIAKAAETSEEEQAKKARQSEKIKELEDKVKQEDSQISQFGKALEECRNNPSQTGSSQHIDCSRHLLIHCQKRQAYLTEISRLKALINPSSKKSQASTTSTNEDLTGMLSFSNIQLPVKESYMNKFKSGEDKRAFYFICLIRYGVQVLQTQVISTHELIGSRDTCITFPNIMSIHNVDVNFRVKVDVYTMEILPRELKHHNSIKQATHNATAKFFSPFKASNLFHHHSSSSSSSSSSSGNTATGGSYAHYSDGHNTNGANCKTSNFIHVDTIEITFRDIDTNKFKLNISSSSIPLSGVLYVNVRCMPMKTIEQRGFMTIFEEDQNGLGTWDRRWCYLNNFNISYWKYPEDEANDKPLGSINLTRCVNESVSLLPRDLCARKFTLELNVDNESVPNEPKTYRLSADTKDQANEWVLNVNQALANIKLWNKKTK